ncbi:MAG TPA: transglutaminase-like cysteine peptidase [Sphingomicrobium sp.]|nr:transglutaminase-like cysteine peptidase [Sphingomicrobium sp.]
MAKARNLILLSALAASAQLAATPAHADSRPSWSFAKSEAILGGQSALAAILAEQNAPPRRLPLIPASTGLHRSGNSLFVRAIRPAISPAIYSGKPDVFGTVALKVGHTPLDGRWHRVENARVGGAAAAFAHALRGSSEYRRIDAVNRYVNKRVRFADDSRQYRRADVWATASDTLSRGRGDCEDYAIAKLQLLRAAGFSDRDLYLVVLKDLVRRSDHAVAVVRTGNQMLVLDNGTDRLIESDSVSDYRPVLTFAANGTWTHGYRVRRLPVQVASASVAEASLAPAGDTSN